MNQLSKTYINMSLEFTANNIPHDYLGRGKGYESADKVILEFKNSSEILRQIENNGTGTGYLQKEKQIKPLAYHSYNLTTQKNNRKLTHCIGQTQPCKSRYLLLWEESNLDRLRR